VWAGVLGLGKRREAEESSPVGQGVVAAGPDGLAQSLVNLLSPAYKDRTVTFGGPITDGGEILARIMVGRSLRLMRMVPASPCAASCLRVTKVQMKGQFVEDPSDPDHCAPDLDAFNRVQAKVTVTTDTGAKVGGAIVEGRFLDDYWTSDPVSGTTNAQGLATFQQQGPCGVGAVAFLVEHVTKGARTLDRTVGTLTGWVIPQ
jgi:hypothetical protein